MDYISQSHMLKDFLVPLECGSIDQKPVFACRPRTVSTTARDTVVSEFTGTIGIAQLDEFKQALDDLVTDRLHKLILDFSSVDLSRTAIGALTSFAASMYGRNKKLYIYQPSPQLRSTLRDLSLTPFFNVLETQEDILLTLFV